MFLLLLVAAGIYFILGEFTDYTIGQVRTLAFTGILMSNIFLTLVNRSFYYSIFKTIRYPNRLAPLILVITTAILAASLFWPAVQSFFGLQPVPETLMLASLAVSFACVFWVEGYKWALRQMSFKVSREKS